MNLRDLSDLELAALISTLHEAVMHAAALQGATEQATGQAFYAPWPMVTELHAAVRAAGAEAIARRAGEDCAARLFPGERLLPAGEAQNLRDLMRLFAGKLEAHGFLKVARLLGERLATEIRTDMSVATRPTAGVDDPRTLN